MQECAKKYPGALSNNSKPMGNVSSVKSHAALSTGDALPLQTF